jgi:RNA polymerase sigma factor (sigma-70 family)
MHNPKNVSRRMAVTSEEPRHAFAEEWDWYLPQTTAWIRSFTKDYDDQQELLQILRIVFQESQHRFRRDGDLGRWMYGLCRRCCRQWVRDNQRRRGRHRAYVDLVDDLVDIECDSEGRAQDYDQRCDDVMHGLSLLTPRQREVVERRILHRQSVTAVATALHRQPGTVKATLHVALGHLRQYVEHRQQSNGLPTASRK